MAAFTKKVCMYSNVVKTDMILIYSECKKMLLPLRVYADNDFPKNSSVFSQLCLRE
jgi:hypothetical protein